MAIGTAPAGAAGSTTFWISTAWKGQATVPPAAGGGVDLLRRADVAHNGQPRCTSVLIDAPTAGAGR